MQAGRNIGAEPSAETAQIFVIDRQPPQRAQGV